MVKTRATITISGEVQDAGFRGKVMRMGQKSGLTGYVENLPNGSVRVISEGGEETIKDFAKMLDIHDDDIEVEDISVDWSDATGEFKWFEVKFSDLGMEMFQGFATAGKKLSAVSQKVDGVGQKVETVGEKVEGVGKDVRVVGGKIDVLTLSTKENFNELGEKYHVISEVALSMQQELVELRRDNTRLLDALTLLVKDYVERGKQ
ncbi:MAG: acylphosphatase [Thermoplasmata archaeon]|nr:acylphosphatase [Thermoplasmata archaeon]